MYTQSHIFYILIKLLFENLQFRNKRTLKRQKATASLSSIVFSFGFLTINCLFRWHLWVNQGYFLWISFIDIFINTKKSWWAPSDMDEKQTLSLNFRSYLLSSTVFSQSYLKNHVIKKHQGPSALCLCDFNRSQFFIEKNITFLYKGKLWGDLFLKFKEIVIHKSLSFKKNTLFKMPPFKWIINPKNRLQINFNASPKCQQWVIILKKSLFG